MAYRTADNRGERQDALGVTDAMMKVYDKIVPRVKPSTIKDRRGKEAG